MEKSSNSSTVNPFMFPDLLSRQQTTDLGIADLQLLHHFTTITSLQLSSHNSAEARALWQLHAVKLGFKHEFLLRGILAVAAMHLSYLLPDRKADYELKASAHQSIGLQLFQENLNRADEYNCHALFAFSCLIVVMAFATPRKDDPQREILHWFHLLRGCNSVCQLHWELLRNSFLSPLLDEMSHTVTKPAHLVPDADRMMDLISTCTSPDQSREVSQAYASAIHELLKAFIQGSVLRSRGEGSTLSSFVWPINLSPKYLELLEEQKPESLVILAHYCILLNWGDEEEEWFLKGWARYTFDTIKVSLGESWHETLAWPEAVISRPLPIETSYRMAPDIRESLEVSMSLMN